MNSNIYLKKTKIWLLVIIEVKSSTILKISQFAIFATKNDQISLYFLKNLIDLSNNNKKYCDWLVFIRTHFFISNVDSSWKTCALENTVRVFLLRLLFDWLSPDRSKQSSSSSSSIDSLISSSESCETSNRRLDDGDDSDDGFGDNSLIACDWCLSGVVFNAAIKWEIERMNKSKMKIKKRFYCCWW